jgi:hypothetical protein
VCTFLGAFSAFSDGGQAKLESIAEGRLKTTLKDIEADTANPAEGPFPPF